MSDGPEVQTEGKISRKEIAAQISKKLDLPSSFIYDVPVEKRVWMLGQVWDALIDAEVALAESRVTQPTPAIQQSSAGVPPVGGGNQRTPDSMCIRPQERGISAEPTPATQYGPTVEDIKGCYVQSEGPKLFEPTPATSARPKFMSAKEFSDSPVWHLLLGTDISEGRVPKDERELRNKFAEAYAQAKLEAASSLRTASPKKENKENG